MKGNMQDYPLVVNRILDFAARWHPEQEVICRTPEGQTVISNYAQVHQRSQLCALALQNLGVKEGSMVGTMAWNTIRHLETWYGIMGNGAICHTLNPRLSDRDLTFIINDAKDQLVLADITFVKQLERILPECPSVQAVIFLTDRQHVPAMKVAVPVLCYEELLGEQVPNLTPSFKWGQVDENTACGLCYTSGTTGNPKGVLYSHRSNFLHALINQQPDSLPLGSSTTILAVVPMFHANSWGIAYAAPMVGAKLVLPGPWLDGESLYDLMERFKVTITAGVPTVWLNLMTFMDKAKLQFSTLKTICIAGAAAPGFMIEQLQRKFNLEVRHMWGMTEISPLGTMGGLKAPVAKKTEAERLTYQVTQGRPSLFCDIRIVDDEGKTMPHDGKAQGHLQVRGPVVVKEYFQKGPGACDAEGWFDTGDVGLIDALGHMQITDRAKDVVKSGGEWISSVQIENIAMAHPAVFEAAVIAIPSVKWGERPLLAVALKPGFPQAHPHAPGTPPSTALTADQETLKEDIYKFLEGKIAKFAMPDDIVIVHEIPHNATGKVSKLALRDMFKGYKPAHAKL